MTAFPTTDPTTRYNAMSRTVTTEYVLSTDQQAGEQIVMKVTTGHNPRTTRASGPVHWTSVGNLRRTQGTGGIAYVDSWSPMSDMHYRAEPAAKRFNRKALETAHAAAVEVLTHTDDPRLMRYFAGDFATA